MPHVKHLLATMAFLSLTCLDGLDAELPVGWENAALLPLRQSACTGSPYASPPHPRLALSRADGALEGRLRDVQFRCDQELCGYVLEVRDVTRVLVQPCDPQAVELVRCDCLYDLAFTLAPRPGRATVELYSRRELYGAHGSIAATLVDREWVP